MSQYTLDELGEVGRARTRTSYAGNHNLVFPHIPNVSCGGLLASLDQKKGKSNRPGDRSSGS